MFHSVNNNKKNYISTNSLSRDILVGKKLFETPADGKGELHPGCHYLPETEDIIFLISLVTFLKCGRRITIR